MSSPKLIGLATTVPPYAVNQAEVKNFAAGLFKDGFRGLDRMLSVFEHGNIKTRHFACPLEWYAESHSFSEANEQFEKTALELAATAAISAIKQADIDPQDIGGVVFITSTGISTPTLDVKLIQRLGLSFHSIRMPIWGLGCAGGVSGLARAAEVARALPNRFVLLVVVELCSITFQRNDFSKANLVGTSIFADGAAAAIIGLNGVGPEIVDSYSTLFPHTEDIMGWDIGEMGLKVRFSRDIPTFIRHHLPGLVGEACQRWGVSRSQLCHYIVHPGGAKVLEAYHDSLSLLNGQLAEAEKVLEGYGNMSSASIFFVLEEFLARTAAADRYAVMLALGPGFSAEQVLLRW
ncbi:Alpha-pyrone synthesis polyketide synthase-like Pks11 [bioreactor metagenome]|uniref:Alpha-pyrone synthesis polyketide synthase-like Pks11 n=1 Tax=bioreactor metagenome TaxID=1076179 RepID=A0A644T9L1_9ZZZZ|nr:3-oxoacyl-[acyl-carrier-protein] synthase III C-terminal domain-containing protein [Negativicutes bacterium]